VPEDVLKKMRESVATAQDAQAFTKFLEDNYVSRWNVEPDDVKAEVEAAKKQYGDLSKRLHVKLSGD
jgi:tripartite-type tricarboxylate transporter receptor subunit TctC